MRLPKFSAPLLRQLHLAQECGIARVARNIAKERIPLDRVEILILLGVRSVQPLEGRVGLVPD
jgi:hypothetical protein